MLESEERAKEQLCQELNLLVQQSATAQVGGGRGAGGSAGGGGGGCRAPAALPPVFAGDSWSAQLWADGLNELLSN